MPLIASKTAACTIAAVRVMFNGDVFATRPMRSIVRFQSVTSSARAAAAVNNSTTRIPVPQRRTLVMSASSRLMERIVEFAREEELWGFRGFFAASMPQKSGRSEHGEDRRFERFFSHAAGMVQPDDAVAIDQHVHRHRRDAVLPVIVVADGNGLVLQEPVVRVAHVDDVAELTVRSSRAAALDISVSPRRR